MGQTCSKQKKAIKLPNESENTKSKANETTQSHKVKPIKIEPRETQELVLFLNGSEFSRQICPLLFSYLGLIYKEISFENERFMSFDPLEPPPIPFLPLLRVGDQWVSGELAICEFACSVKSRGDLLGENSEEVVKIRTILILCDDVLRRLLRLERKALPAAAKNHVIEREIHPILSSFNIFIRGRKGFLDSLTLPDFYLYVILIQLNAIYENTYRNYFWLQKFKMSMDMFLAEKMAGNNFSPALKTIEKEIEKDWKMESSELLYDGQIPLESRLHSNMNEIEFLKDVNHIPESFCQSLRMSYSQNIPRTPQTKI